MPTPEELQQDKDFMQASPADQIKYLSETDPDFKAAHPDDQAAYLAHVTKQPTGAEAMQPKPGITGKLDTAGEVLEKGLEPVDKAVTEALAPRPTGEVLPTEYREVPKALLRNVYGTGKAALGTIAGLPSAIGHAFGDEATPEERARYAEGEKAAGEAPGTETSGLKRIGLGVERLLGAEQAKEGLKAYLSPETRPTYEQALSVAEPAIQAGAGTVLGMEAAGKLAKLPSKETMPTTTGAVEKGVRGLGKAYQAVRERAPEVGATVGGTIGAVKGPGGAAYGMYTGGRIGKILQKITPEGTAVAEYGLTTEERNVQRLENAATQADKAAQKAEDAHSVYAASEKRGPIDPGINPAYRKSLDNLNKARAAQAEAHFHLQEAKRAAQEAAATIEGQAREITPAEVEAARPEPTEPSPTDAELKMRQEKLMGDLEKKVGIEPAKPTPINVRTPGQVGAETFPQEPTEAPRVEETTRMRPLAGEKGVIVGRPPRLLGEGTPEAPAEVKAEKAPLGEVLPPEKPAKPGRLGALKVSEGGKVVDTEPELQQKLEEGLQKGTKESKPVALKPLAAREAEVLGKMKPIPVPPERTEITGHRLGVPTGEPEDVGARTRTELPAIPRGERRARVRTPEEEELTSLFRQARKELGEDATNEQIDARMEELKAAKAEPEKAERTPEDLSKIQKLLSDHTDQELIREANRRGIDESQYDLSKREGESRHRVDRNRMINDIMDKMPDADKDKLIDLSDRFDNKKDTSLWTEAERSQLSRGARARAIMQEFRGGPARVAGGAPEEVPERAGTEESAKQDQAYFAQAKKELPEGTVSQQLMRAQELKTKGALPIPDKPEELQEATKSPFKILGQEELKPIKPKAEEAIESKVSPAPAEPRTAIDRSKVQGGEVSQPHTNYHEASQGEENPWVRRSVDPANDSMPTNEKRTLMVQFASDLLQKEAMNDDAKAYYDKLYSGAREGYARMRDFWETPQWMGFASHMLPDADVYVVRDMEQAKNFLNSAKYGNVLFSALDVNAPFIGELAKSYDGKFDVGGYTKPEAFEGVDNITWHDSMKDFAKAKGIEYKDGVDYRHFEGSDVIPRLTLSDGCLHKCAFCIVEKAIKETPADVVNQQADAIANMKSKLVYLNDKTFGQAPNYKTLPALYDRIREKNPDFQGFVIQTTAAQTNKLTSEFLKKSGIKFAEIGVETYNDALLKELHKPATESLIDKAVTKYKDAGIAVIPNIIIGMPGETAETYAHTLAFLKKNADAISHANIYNLAIYKDSELGQKMATGAGEASDFDENVLHKSFHTDPQVHATFAGDLYDLGEKLLSKKVGDPLEETKSERGFSPVDKEEYFKAVKDSPSTATLTSTEDMKDNRAFKSPEGVYYSLDPKGDIQAVVNNSLSVWNLVSAIQDAVSRGGKTLDAWDLVLPKFYESIGFENTEHVPYDEKTYGPPSQELKDAWKTQGWKEGDSYPGVQHMKVSDDMLKEYGPKPLKPVREMTEAEKEELAAKGQSGGAPGEAAKAEKQKPMPTGDELIKKYGESSGDPAHTAFILPDGRGVALGSVDHDTMLGGKATDKVPRREQFIDQGNIRIRPRVGRGGREFSISIPESGITTEQLSYMKKMAPQLSSGTVMMEVGKRGGAFKEIPYGKASAELENTIRELGPVKSTLGELAEKHLTPEERQGVTKSPQQLERFIQRMESMPEVQEWTDAAQKGAGERKWYQRSTQAFDAMSKEAPEYFDQPGDRDKFIGMLAASSPQQAVAMNMREALKVWTNYVDAGRPTGAKLEKLLSQSPEKGGFTLPGAKIPNAMKALAGEQLWPDITKNKNFKVPSFQANLTGMLDKVTNDGWMALFAGLEAKDISSAHSYHPISVMTRAAAEELGWKPAEAQAAIWAFIKTLTEKGVSASEDPYEMRQYSEDFADIILHDPQTRELLKDMGVDIAKLDERIGKEVERKPAPESGRTSPTSEVSAKRAFERVEEARGKGTIPAPKTGLLHFGEPDEAIESKPEEFESGKNPKQIAKGGSGESAASLEEINRSKAEKSKGIKYFRIDSRSGRETPIIGAGALDAVAGPYEHIVRRGPDGEVVLDSGSKARPLGIIKGKK